MLDLTYARKCFFSMCDQITKLGKAFLAERALERLCSSVCVIVVVKLSRHMEDLGANGALVLFAVVATQIFNQ